MTSPPVPQPGVSVHDFLPSRLIHLFTGLCFLFVALGFSYLDRRYGFFLTESVFWVAWTALGFTAGACTQGRGATGGQNFSLVLTAIAVLLAIFPAFFMYTLLRWICVMLLLVMAARAPVMHSRRDLYLCLTACFAVSFMAATHGAADWTLWLYLGPAWIFAGLALTWDYASSKAINHGMRLGMNLGFVAITAVIAAAMFLVMPRPPLLGFGFIPPAADAPGLFDRPAGRTPDGDNKKPGSSAGAGNSSGAADAAGGNSGTSTDDSWHGQWQGMLQKMRPALKDPAMPQWQKGLLEKLLNGAEALGEILNWPADATPLDGRSSQARLLNAVNCLAAVLLALLALALAWLIYRRRYWLGIELMHFGAWTLATPCPLLSMRMSAQAMKFCLTDAGHQGKPGQSVREYLRAAPQMPQLARRWFGYAVDLYCETRFGAVQATPTRAGTMRQAVSAATQLVKGHAPEMGQK